MFWFTFLSYYSFPSYLLSFLRTDPIVSSMLGRLCLYMTSSACWSVVGTEHRKFKNLMILRSADSVFPVLSPCLWAYSFLFNNWLLYWSRLAKKKKKWPLKKRFQQFLLGLVCDFICIWVLTKKAGLSLWFVKGYLGPSAVQSGLWQHPILHLIHCTFPSWWVGLSIPVLPMQKLKVEFKWNSKPM